MAIEEPPFTVESKNEIYEIRNYQKILVAETEIDAAFDKAGNKAFKILADYIFGNNKSKSKIAMTAPVTQQAASEKIAMTAPVSQIKSSGGFLIQFTLPQKFNLENVPTPNDARVQIREITARKIAVLQYSGSWSQSSYQQKLLQLNMALEKDGLRTKGEAVWARYNSPFQLWFLRRNEIWREVDLIKS